MEGRIDSRSSVWDMSSFKYAKGEIKLAVYD